jgi:hypothetical protein
VVLADRLHPLVHAFQRRQRIASVAHEDDSLHDVGIHVLAYDSQARRRPLADVRHVANADGRALLLGEDDLSDVGERVDETDPAHVEALLAERQPLAADVLVGAPDPLVELGERERVALETVRVDVDVVLLGLSAEGDDVDDPRDLAELSLEDEVLRGLQLG